VLVVVAVVVLLINLLLPPVNMGVFSDVLPNP
jgi:hypothetical protein